MFKKYFKNQIQFTQSSLLISILSILILSWSQILQPLELAIYDLGFKLRPNERPDERVVIVSWDESAIQGLGEINISDRTLALLLEKIKEQGPRVIGLDIYRDINVSSPHLSDEDNVKSYKSLSQIFKTTKNLIVIEKTIKPQIYAPIILKQKDQVAASDLPVDQDRSVRRSYIYPKVTEQGKAAELEYLGVRVAYEYLADENFGAEESANNSLRIFRDKSEAILTPLKSFIGMPRDDQFSFNVLVNWRKSKFKTVSVLDVLNNRVFTNSFKDKVVLIGTTAISTADRHITPINRWDNSFAFGVEIQAQVTSSIISTSLDNRLLLNPASSMSGILGIIISSALISFLIKRKRNLRTIKLYFVSLLYALGLSLTLVISSLFSFNLGYWLPITTSLGNIWVLYFALNYYLYKAGERRRINLLEAFIADFNHGIGNRLSSINSSQRRIETFATDVKESLQKLKEITQDDINKIDTIIKRAKNIENQSKRIKEYQEIISYFIDYGYLSRASTLEKTNLNWYLSEIDSKFAARYEHESHIVIKAIYDPQLNRTKVLVDKLAIAIVIENLLENAAYAVLAKSSTTADHIPKITIESKLLKNRVQITVEDNGTGIPKRNQQKIFDPFISFQAGSSGQGIGLFLVRKIADIYNGSIKVESEEEIGSKFIFTIPTSTD